MLHYKIRNLEPFKDGNVLGDRFLKPGEVLIIDENTKNRIEQSGAVFEVLETLVKNPMKELLHQAEVEMNAAAIEKAKEETVEAPRPKKGKSKKNA